MSHVTHGWVMSHVDESCHMWVSHVTCGWLIPQANQASNSQLLFCLPPCAAAARSVQLYMGHDSFIRDMIYSYVTWLIDMCREPLNCHFVFHLVLQRLDLYIYKWDMTRLYVTWFIHTWRDSLICVASLSIAILSSTLCCSGSICTFINGTWLVYTWHDLFIRDVTHWYVSQASQLPFCLPPCAAAARSVHL